MGNLKHGLNEYWESTNTLISICLSNMIRISESEVTSRVLRLKWCNLIFLPSRPCPILSTSILSQSYTYSKFLILSIEFRLKTRTNLSPTALLLTTFTSKHVRSPKHQPNLGLLHLRLQNSSKPVLQVLSKPGLLPRNGQEGQGTKAA
jgi:hypothetical protein